MLSVFLDLSTRRLVGFLRFSSRMSSVMRLPTPSTQSARLSLPWMLFTLSNSRDVPCTDFGKLDLAFVPFVKKTQTGPLGANNSCKSYDQ